MEMKNITSSNISKVGYDPKENKLRVEFNNGGIWEYQDVSENKFNEFMGSTSKGSFFHKNIKNSHTAIKI